MQYLDICKGSTRSNNHHIYGPCARNKAQAEPRNIMYHPTRNINDSWLYRDAATLFKNSSKNKHNRGNNRYTCQKFYILWTLPTVSFLTLLVPAALGEQHNNDKHRSYL